MTGNKNKKNSIKEPTIRRLDSTHVEYIWPNGTKNIVLSEVPLAPDGDKWLAGLLMGGKGLGLFNTAYNLYKWNKENQPYYVGPFNLGKKTTYDQVSRYPKPWYVKAFDMISPFNKGGRIKIKPSRRGTFTSYCGGKVTQECINRAKNSPNKSIRKKAVFAENARKWNKKKFGGIFKAEEGLDTEKLKSIVNGASSLMGLVGTFMKNKQANTYINSMREAQKKQNDALYQQQLNQNFRNAYDSYQAPEGENMSNIVRTKRAYESALLNTVKPTNNNPELDMYEQQLNQQKWDDIQNYSNSLLDSWKNLSGNINWGKKKKKDTFSVDNETKQLIANSNPNKWRDDLAGTYNKGETA